MKQYLNKIIQWFIGSMDNLPGGASSKKLTAFGAAIIAASITIIWAYSALKHNDWGLLPIVLPMWLALVYAALNLNSKEKEKHLLNNKEDGSTTP